MRMPKRISLMWDGKVKLRKALYADDIEYVRVDLAEAENERLKDIVDSLIRVKQAADGSTPLMSNQGQALDGYSERANYRSIIDRAMKGG